MSLSLVPQTADDHEFLTIFNRLCVALREPQDDTGITQGVYWDALHDLSLVSLQTAADALSKQGRRKFFPTTAEWRAEAERAQTVELRQAVSVGPRTEPWKHECYDCEDTGWIVGMTCDGGSACGRKTRHLAHDYTMPCPCRPTNRTFRRHLAFGGGAA
jgi:hypothetical protein